MTKLLKKLVDHLRENRNQIVRSCEVCVEVYDPTYGLSNRTETIDVIDFDTLCYEIDRFAETFQND